MCMRGVFCHHHSWLVRNSATRSRFVVATNPGLFPFTTIGGAVASKMVSTLSSPLTQTSALTHASMLSSLSSCPHQSAGSYLLRRMDRRQRQTSLFENRLFSCHTLFPRSNSFTQTWCSIGSATSYSDTLISLQGPPTTSCSALLDKVMLEGVWLVGRWRSSPRIMLEMP